METLKIIADWCYGKKPQGTRSYEDIPDEERDWNSGWYLHGKLEELVKFDKALVTNCKSGGFYKKTINYKKIVGDKVIEITKRKPKHMMCFDGIVDVEVEGIPEPCIGYFWTDSYYTVYWRKRPYQIWRQRGLVCLKSDIKGCEYAKQKYEERSGSL